MSRGGKIKLLIPMERIKASQTPEALARAEKEKQELMKRVPMDELKEMWKQWKKERGIE